VAPGKPGRAVLLWAPFAFSVRAMRAEYSRLEEETTDAHVLRLQGLLEKRDCQVAELERSLAAALRQQPGHAGQDWVELPHPWEVQDEEAEGSDMDRRSAARDGLEEAEKRLTEESHAAQNPAVLQLLASLQAAAVYTDTPNHETNRKLWDAYAKNWSPEEAWVKRMAGHLQAPPAVVRCVGDEWADEASLHSVLEAWVMPHLSSDVRAAEIGSGGGRIAANVAKHVRELVCFDISDGMLKAAKTYLESCGAANVVFQLVDGNQDYPPEFDGSFEFVYSFDVFVHLDLHQMRRTLRSIRKLLRPGGLCFISFANILAPDGWRRFVRQQQYSVGGFYFVSPDIVRCLLARGGLELWEASTPRAGNTYLSRDLLVLARRPVDAPA